ncbi:MAG: pyruvate, phosphate dikinase [Balneolaceae bacterium]|nr:MAG: pyruvate, phosphate dikinase [Balneolaceae bacterium]
MHARNKYVYLFGGGKADGDQSMKELLGGKGANLAEMSKIGLPVPAGFTITTESCAWYNDNDHQWPEHLHDQVLDGIVHLEENMGARFGDAKNPLLVSVRSGAKSSMPGMMDTVLNLGMNDQVVEGLAKKTKNERFAFDSYRRFIDMFGDVVMGVDHEHFEECIHNMKSEVDVKLDSDLDGEQLRDLVDRYKAVYRRHTGFMFPEDPYEQLRYSINAVFNSWNSSRAIKYRQINRIRGLLGTAVNVQAMVYGNMGDDCATGVLFTRNPSTGENKLYGEYLINAQGEDVVAGIRTPEPITSLKKVMPDSYKEIETIATNLEKHYKNMQDIEFTIQSGKLFILQTRNGKRTGQAAIRIATDMVDEKLITTEMAVRDLVEPQHLDQLLHPQFTDDEPIAKDILGTGLPASPGAAVGKVIFDADNAEKAAARGESVILVRVETSPEDVGGMSAAKGILTSRGGMTSHAAVVARGWGKPCVAGCGDIIINYKKKSFTNGKITIKEGEWISIDGTMGIVVKGKKELTDPKFDDHFHKFMKWVDKFRTTKVRANADTPDDAAKALEFGAEGIGLARTEHMFFGDKRINAVRRMIIAETPQERRKALNILLPYQRDDFLAIFRLMGNRPVTVRLLDPPLHEFLPHEDDEIIHVAHELNIPAKVLKHKIQNLKEFNPMLGHRGCRLGIVYPEITEMQTRAILEAAVTLKKEGLDLTPEIMIPLIGTVEEFIDQREVIDRVASQIFKEMGAKVDYLVGTMIEVPRAALTAGKIAAEAEFFSFGTNDLTQTTFAYSRDDAGKFLIHYVTHKILPDDPFQVLDTEGVGRLVEIATREGRAVKPDLKVGICGEHGGEPHSIAFFYKTGLDYVSCSPFRLPLARLALAQVHLKTQQQLVEA